MRYFLIPSPKTSILKTIIKNPTEYAGLKIFLRLIALL